MVIKIYTDGGAIGNPGPAAFAYIIYKDKKIVASHSERIGRTTNNLAEYTGLIKALEKTKYLITNYQLLITHISVYSDSRLMINQLNGYFKVKNAAIREYIFKIRTLENQINLPIVYRHILREQNRAADSLVKKTLGAA
jgi:ribonuclease HI